MRAVRSLLNYIFGASAKQGLLEDPLDYEQVVHLDAEELAEQGIQEAYNALLPRLRQYSGSPLEVVEEVDGERGIYSVLAGGVRYEIWGPDLKPNDGWARASVAFFSIVNRGLEASAHKFYALYSDNDLSGVFLTEEEYLQARRAIEQRSSWPYLLVNEPPHYGFPASTVA